MQAGLGRRTITTRVLRYHSLRREEAGIGLQRKIFFLYKEDQCCLTGGLLFDGVTWGNRQPYDPRTMPQLAQISRFCLNLGYQRLCGTYYCLGGTASAFILARVSASP